MDNESSLLQIIEIQGRGRSLVSTKPLQAGQVILRDSPILLYSASPLYCDNCLKLLPKNDTVFTCKTCSLSRFCSLPCLSSPTHSPWLCQTLIHLRTYLRIEFHLQLRFLISAYNLSLISPPDFRLLLSLQGTPSQNDDVSLLQFLHSLIPPTGSLDFPPSLELTATLLAKDKVNSFGLMEPFVEWDEGRRSVRGYGIYPKASFFNHDCLPNACRFDYLDSGGERNTEIVVRMIHDVPEGREVCLSYFPVNLRYKERQKQLWEDYEFICECDRCKVEANWSDNDEIEGNEEEEDAMDEEGDEDEAMAVGEHVEGDRDGDGDGDFPHAYFFLRFLCNRESCGGTLAPLPDAGQSNLLECNVCGSIKKDEVV